MSKRSFQFVLALIIGLMFAFGDAFLLFAQETTTEEFTLEEITVTAQKREENQQKVPIFMEVISGDQLAATGKTSIDDILLNTANNIVLKATDGLKVSLRGLAETELPFFDLHASTPTVAIKIDGAYNSSSSAGQSLFDVERVEVLYGPQSTMYASNSPGGIVNIVTIAPKLNKYEAQGSLDIGNFNRTDAQVAFNAPIVGDKLAIRLAAGQTKRDTYVSNSDGFGEDTKKARLKTLYQPNDKLSLTLTLNWSQSGNGGMMGCQVKIFDYQDGTKVTNPWTATDTGGGGGMGGPGGGGYMLNDPRTYGVALSVKF